MDVALPQASLAFLNSMLTVAGGLGLIIVSTPAVTVAIVPLFIIYYRVQASPLGFSNSFHDSPKPAWIFWF